MSAPAETLENIITKLRSLADYARIGADELEARTAIAKPELTPLLKRIEIATRALCDMDHDGPCLYPTCNCRTVTKSEYIRQARAVVAALDNAP